MKKIVKVLQAIFGLIIIGLLTWGGYKLLLAVALLFKSVDPTLGAGMLAASATVLVSVVSVLFSKKQEHKVDIENQLRVKKIPIYENIIEFIFLITFAEKLGKAQPTEQEMIAFFADTTRDLVIWGSKDIVKAFGDFKDKLGTLAVCGDTAGMLATVEDFLFAIRKDLGHKHTKIKRGDILRLYINDVDAYFPRLNKACQQDIA
ncbi:hypothetical protein ACRN9J_02810 [Shewanella baltica]|jgi:hypothetical protein|uniref:hypothetical protein n=1 Tax=Shewanella baltica TaxID=62322 RepID=UPI00217D3E0E|nr:hypothetical protein [Shewanella baltica]MCS6096805.1 hypothetical protein [Shewanella baltica]MCS6227822.1 hypothetical protein [Shewanella baltica]